MIGCGDTLIKVCGLTRQEDASLCLDLGVSLCGFIFHPASPRNITPQAAAAIKTGEMMRVGVFLDQTPDQVLEIMATAGLHLAQLHGDQDEDFCRALGRSKIMRVFWPERYETRQELESEIERFSPLIRFILLDAGGSGGGHGRSLDFSFLKGLGGNKTWFLAGGLGPHNLAQAIAACAPCGVDLNSGVEVAPGIKDEQKLRATVAHVCPKIRV